MDLNVFIYKQWLIPMDYQDQHKGTPTLEPQWTWLASSTKIGWYLWIIGSRRIICGLSSKQGEGKLARLLENTPLWDGLQGWINTTGKQIMKCMQKTGKEVSPRSGLEQEAKNGNTYFHWVRYRHGRRGFKEFRRPPHHTHWKGGFFKD